MANKIGEIVTCQGCLGLGITRFVHSHEITCVACEGKGKVRKLPSEVWCARCIARGEIQKGTWGLETYGTCPICNGRGRVEVK
jgi:DnaJ-class molecular chaperone